MSEWREKLPGMANTSKAKHDLCSLVKAHNGCLASMRCLRMARAAFGLDSESLNADIDNVLELRRSVFQLSQTDSVEVVENALPPVGLRPIPKLVEDFKSRSSMPAHIHRCAELEIELARSSAAPAKTFDPVCLAWCWHRLRFRDNGFQVRCRGCN